ncbi:MAG TPA: GreA/GreB family elongation factor [Candidatus Dojkabacteria bacterium]|nr:GreA/GreB family elongation factor [Candidatus Dojkabacteria bacterium]
MKQKQKLYEQLLEEVNSLKIRRDELLDKVDSTRTEYNEEYPSPVLEDCIIELQSVVNQICDLENTLKTMRLSKKMSKIGEKIKVGNCVTLQNHDHNRQYFIANETGYINPGIGIISSSSPIGQKLLNSKFGEKIALMLNGTEVEYELMP